MLQMTNFVMCIQFIFVGLKGLVFKTIVIFVLWNLSKQIFDFGNSNIPDLQLVAMVGFTFVVFVTCVRVRSIPLPIGIARSEVVIPMINCVITEHDNNHVLIKLRTQIDCCQIIRLWFLYHGFLSIIQYFMRIRAGFKMSMKLMLRSLGLDLATMMIRFYNLTYCMRRFNKREGYRCNKKMFLVPHMR